jgi:hypothetical protein
LPDTISQALLVRVQPSLQSRTNVASRHPWSGLKRLHHPSHRGIHLAIDRPFSCFGYNYTVASDWIEYPSIIEPSPLTSVDANRRISSLGYQDSRRRAGCPQA